MKPKKMILVCLLPILLLVSCGGGGGSSTTATDNSGNNTSTANSYVKVNKIITTNCLSCHGPFLSQGAPMSLTTFAQVNFSASLISIRINKLAGDIQLMPLNKAKLSDADIATIDSWIAEGAKNN